MSDYSNFVDDKFSVGKGLLRLTEIRDGHDPWQVGEFLDPRGIVTVYRQTRFPLTRIDFMHNGKVYCRSWDRYCGDRTIRRLAREFISDVQAATPKEMTDGIL